MRKTISVATMLLLAGSLAIAQSNHDQARGAQNRRIAPVEREQRGSIGQAIQESQGSRVTGCLQRAEGGLFLRSRDGGRYRLTGHTTNLDRYIGHEVSLEGTEPSNDHSSSAGRMFRVTNANDVARTCASGPQSDRSSRGIAEPANGGNDAYQANPERRATDSTMPNPPLNHARPEDETPSAGPARNSNRVGHSRTRTRAGHQRKNKSTRPEGNSAPAPKG